MSVFKVKILVFQVEIREMIKFDVDRPDKHMQS